MIRAIVFDFGNVVGFFDHHRTLERLAPWTSWTPRRMYDEIYSGSLEDDVESGKITVDEFLAKFIERCELRCDVGHLRSACGDIFTPNPAVCELIPHLRQRHRLILGSNTNALHAERFRRQFSRVLEYFHAQIVSYEIGVRKPKAGFFEACAAAAGEAPEACLFIDDLPANVAGAEAIGMRGLVYHPGVDLPGELRKRGVRWEG
jgi:putative hydrolase of the HAD superfamily